MSPKAFCVNIPACNYDRGRAFTAVIRLYRELHGAAGPSRADPYRFTALGAWARSRAPHVFSFFRRVGLARYQMLLDLGSGDGLVACIAGLFTRAAGIEIDPELCRLARRAARDLGVSGRVEFICGDYLELPIQRADCLYLYPDKPMRDLEAQLAGWRGDLLVYGPHFPPRSMQPILKLACGRERLILYRNP